jgi:hypothetical protein
MTMMMILGLPDVVFTALPSEDTIDGSRMLAVATEANFRKSLRDNFFKSLLLN